MLGPQRSEADFDYEETVARTMALGAEGGDMDDIWRARYLRLESASGTTSSNASAAGGQQQQHAPGEPQLPPPTLPQPLVLRHHREPGGNVVLPSFGSLFARFGEGDVGSVGGGVGVGGDGSEDDENMTEGIIGGVGGSVDADPGASVGVEGATGGHDVDERSRGEHDAERDSEAEAPADTPLDRSLELEVESAANESANVSQMEVERVVMDADTDADADVGNTSSSQLSAHEVELALRSVVESDSDPVELVEAEADADAAEGPIVNGIRWITTSGGTDSFANDSTLIEPVSSPGSNGNADDAGMNKSDFLTREEIGTMLGFGSGAATSASGGSKVHFDAINGMDVDAMAMHHQQHRPRTLNAPLNALPVDWVSE